MSERTILVLWSLELVEPLGIAISNVKNILSANKMALQKDTSIRPATHYQAYLSGLNDSEWLALGDCEGWWNN